MSKNLTEEERFFLNLNDLMALIYELSVMCWESGFKDVSPKLVELAEGFLKTSDKNKIINAFIKNSYIYWGAPQLDDNGCILRDINNKYVGKGGEIKIKDEPFFIQNAYKIFGNLPVGKEQINAIGVFFTAKDEHNDYVIEKEDRDAIWIYIHSLVKISIKYIHRIRGMKLVNKDGVMIPKYIEPLYPKIKIKDLVQVWNIKLDYPTS